VNIFANNNSIKTADITCVEITSGLNKSCRIIAADVGIRANNTNEYPIQSIYAIDSIGSKNVVNADIKKIAAVAGSTAPSIFFLSEVSRMKLIKEIIVPVYARSTWSETVKYSVEEEKSNAEKVLRVVENAKSPNEIVAGFRGAEINTPSINIICITKTARRTARRIVSNSNIMRKVNYWIQK